MGTEAGIHEDAVVNGDGLHTIAQSRLTRRLGAVGEGTLHQICRATALAIGCDGPQAS